MENIQRIALETYSENLKYLELHDNELFYRISTFSSLIEDGSYNARYHLDYISDDNTFDIFDELNNVYVYNNKPKDFITNAVENINLDKINSIDLLNPDIYNITQKITISNNQSTTIKCNSMYHNDIFEYIKVFNKSTVDNRKKFKYINKFIFIGTLLGSHIESVDKKINSKLYMIYEYNLEIFRLSLFVTNYAMIAEKSTLLFSIMDDDDILNKKILYFTKQFPSSNYMVKYFCTNYNINNFFDKVLLAALQYSPFNYSYRLIMENLISLSLDRIPKYHILDTFSKQLLLENHPTLLVAAGPSLSKNLEWIKQNKNKFCIVAIGAVVSKLIENGIKPDIITSVDYDELIKKQFPDKLKNELSSIPLLAAVSTSQYVLDMFDYNNTTLFEVMSSFKEHSTLPGGSTIGEVSLYLISTLGAKEVYMIGTDMAFDQETGYTHIDEHIHNRKYNVNEERCELNLYMKDGEFNIRDSSMLVKGNFRESVFTNATMARSVNAYNLIINLIKKFNPNIDIYNLSDGAYFEGTIPTKIDSVRLENIIDKYLLKDDILNHLNSFSQIGFTEDEKISLLKSCKSIDKLISQVETLQNNQYMTYKEFSLGKESIIHIIGTDLKKISKFYIDKVFENYLYMMEPYLEYQFNDQNLENEMDKVAMVQQIWCEQVLSLAKRYKELLIRIL